MKTIRNMSVFSPMDGEIKLNSIMPPGANSYDMRARYYSPSAMILLIIRDELKTHQLELH
jgi:hypothetical protein